MKSPSKGAKSASKKEEVESPARARARSAVKKQEPESPTIKARGRSAARKDVEKSSA